MSRLQKLGEHYFSIVCPHCGEEFGIEDEINQAREEQDTKTASLVAREIKKELGKRFPFIWQGTNEKPWQSFWDKVLGG